MEQDTRRYIQSLWEVVDKEEGPYNGNLRECISVTGLCHDCGIETFLVFDRNTEVVGGEGGIWHFSHLPRAFVKCGPCFDKDPVLRNFQPCEVFSRVVGYLRPVRQWNAGKRAEFKQRVTFDMEKAYNRSNSISRSPRIDDPSKCDVAVGAEGELWGEG